MLDQPNSRERPTLWQPSISATVALLTLAVFWTASLRQMWAERATPGPTTSSFRGLFETNAPGIRAFAMPTNGLLYLFGERRGADTVFVARSSRHGGVLFFTPELRLERADPESESAFARNAGIVRARAVALREAGVARVLLVPVPTKASVLLAADASLRSQLGEVAGGQATTLQPWLDGRRTAEVYERFVRAFDAADGIAVVQLQRLFVSRATSTDDPVFAYEDSHWTSLGLNLAAAEIVRVWRGSAPTLVPAGRLADQPGDLQRLLALPDSGHFRTHPFAEQVYELSEAGQGEACQGGTFLLGTSYSTHRAQTLGGELRRASGCAVTDLSLSGQGAVASFRSLFDDHAGQLRGATVIWEFPFRDLVDPTAFVEGVVPRGASPSAAIDSAPRAH